MRKMAESVIKLNLMNVKLSGLRPHSEMCDIYYKVIKQIF